MPRSLQGRMLLLSAVATLLSLALAGWAITGVLERFVTAGLDRRLDAEIALLASTVDARGKVDQARLGARVAAMEAGPGWRWRIETPDRAIGSADFPVFRDPPLPPPPGALPGPTPEARPDAGPGPKPERAPAPPDRLRSLDGSDEEGMMHARQLVIASQRGPVTLMAAAPRDVVRQPIRGAVAPLLAALVALAGVLSVAAVVQLRLGLRPLRRLRDQVAGIRSGTRAGIDEDVPTELHGLVQELNALAADNAAALATARQSAANLAHALKTPVATLALDAHDDPAQIAQIARIDATIRHHLARARVVSANHRVSTPLAPAVADLVGAVRRIHDAVGLDFTTDIAGDLSVAVDPRDLDEMIGNLLDNATKHARAAIRADAAFDPGDRRRVVIRIADDGLGLSPAECATVTQPGVRLDQRADGDGFGLAIVSDLSALYGGSLSLGRADAGGLLATLTLPAAA